MWEDKFQDLIIILATVSLVSWSAVGATALVRAAAKLRYQRRWRASPQMTQPTEEAGLDG